MLTTARLTHRHALYLGPQMKSQTRRRRRNIVRAGRGRRAQRQRVGVGDKGGRQQQQKPQLHVERRMTEVWCDGGCLL